jgi:uncharacterized membrane protein YfcA
LRKAGQHSWYEGLPLKMRFARSGLYISTIPLVALAVIVGFAGTLLGIGGGFIVVPALIYLFRIKTSVVVGTSLVQILAATLAATLLHSLTNQSVDLFLAILLIIGGVFGAQFGARAGLGLRGEQFRLLLALLVFGMALRFASNLLHVPPDPFTASTTETYR